MPRAMLLGSFTFAALFAIPAAAQKPDADETRTLAAYRLTMPVLRAALAADRELESDPRYERIQPLMERRAFGNGGIGVAELAKAVEGVPAAKHALERAGMSPRQWATAMCAWLDAEFALMSIELAADASQPAPALPAHVPKANVEFLRKHRAEIDRLVDGP